MKGPFPTYMELVDIISQCNETMDKYHHEVQVWSFSARFWCVLCIVEFIVLLAVIL